jgi:lipoyl-dependent peroxiredoxin
MAKAERSANARWAGNLTDGKGTVKMASGACGELPVTWSSRTEHSDGKTSPEELIAAAHAACYSMAFSHELASAGHAPTQLDVKATCTIEQVTGGWAISTMQIDVTGDVPGMDSAAFAEIASKAKTGCPVSKALADNVQISLNAQLKKA